MQSAQCSGGDEGRNTGDVRYGNACGLQLLIYIMYGRIEARISFGHDAHALSPGLQLPGFRVDPVVGFQCAFALFAHGQVEAADGVFGHAELQQDVGSP